MLTFFLDISCFFDIKVKAIFDETVKSRKTPVSSYRRRPETSKSNMFWIPAVVGMTVWRLFTSPSIFSVIGFI
uniref:Uncharacterized protein n=1 Tax=uncultured Desulfobacterium sp. TaxID=201089 RepID=E1YID8_9BACT|nr:unknown protein [uncultured Desulfobacterium sp.]